MKLNTREDVEAPLDYVFARASDFAAFERRAIREGAKIERQHSGPVVVGSVWDIQMPVRGREKHFVATLSAMDAPQGYAITSQGEGVSFVASLDLVALSPRRTRVNIGIEISARTLLGRLLMQTLKLGKTRLSAAFKSRVASLAHDIAEDYRKRA